MAFQVYVDDSGTGRNGPVFLLAGVEAAAASWAAFSDEWRAVLEESPRVAYFKASECFSGKGAFRDLSLEECRTKAAGLAAVMARHVTGSYVVSVRHDDFDSVFLQQIAPPYDNPYLLVAQDLCEQIILIYAKERPQERVEFIFDSATDTVTRVQRAFAASKEASIGTAWEHFYSKIMPSLPTFSDEKISIPLQAADMWAWFMRRVISGEVIPFISGSAFDLIKEIPCNYFGTDKSTLVEKRDGILASLPEGKVFYHQLIKNRATFDEEITKYNLNVLSSGDDYPTLASFSTKQMKQRCLVHSCPDIGTPHLHTRDGKQCLGGTA